MPVFGLFELTDDLCDLLVSSGAEINPRDLLFVDFFGACFRLLCRFF